MPPSVNTLWVNKHIGRYKSKRGKEFEEIAKYELKEQYKGKKTKNGLRLRYGYILKLRLKGI